MQWHMIFALDLDYKFIWLEGLPLPLEYVFVNNMLNL